MDPRNPDFWSRVSTQELKTWQPVCSRLSSLLPIPAPSSSVPSLFVLFLFLFLSNFIHVLLQGYKAIAAYYGGRLSTCLMQLYPDIDLKQSHFGNGLYPHPCSLILALSVFLILIFILYFIVHSYLADHRQPASVSPKEVEGGMNLMDSTEEDTEHQVRSHQGILEAALSSIFPTRNILYHIIHHAEYSLIYIFTRD